METIVTHDRNSRSFASNEPSGIRSEVIAYMEAFPFLVPNYKLRVTENYQLKSKL
jgi:hypothetical protein